MSHKTVVLHIIAQHVARALVVVSFTLEHYFTFHMHSSATFHPTMYQIYPARIHRMCLSASLAETHSLTGYDLTVEDTSVLVKPTFLTQTEYDVDL